MYFIYSKSVCSGLERVWVPSCSSFLCVCCGALDGPRDQFGRSLFIQFIQLTRFTQFIHFIHCKSSFSVFMWLRSFSPWISLCSKSVCRGLLRDWMPSWSPFWCIFGGCGWYWRRVWSGSDVLERLEVCLQCLWGVEDIFIWFWNDEIGTVKCGLRSLPKDVVGQLSATC